jgi:hypothetical protein
MALPKHVTQVVHCQTFCIRIRREGFPYSPPDDMLRSSWGLRLGNLQQYPLKTENETIYFEIILKSPFFLWIIDK